MEWIGAVGCLGLLLGGCGGQSGAGTGPSTGSVGQTSNIGDLAVTSTGRAKPLITSSAGNVSTFAQAGASYTSIVCNPAKNLADTFLVVSRNLIINGTSEIAKISYQGGAEVPVISSNPVDTWINPSIAQNGRICAINASSATLWGVLPDGSGLENVLGTNAADSAAISPNGATIGLVFSKLYTEPFGGGAQTSIGGGPTWTYLPLSFSANGTSLVGLGFPSSSTTLHIFETSVVAQSTATDVTPFDYMSGTWSSVSWSPLGPTLIGGYSPSQNGASELLEFNPSDNASQVLNLTPSGLSDSFPAFSPDGSLIAFYRSSAGGATPGVYVENVYGLSAQLLEADPSGTSVGGLAWSYFLPSKTFVGAGGALGSTAAAFLYSQVGSRFASLISVSAKTPSTASVIAPSAGSGTGAMLYTFTADDITAIAYTNVYIGQATTLGVSQPTSIVSVDALTGLVDNVVSAAVPATTTRSGTMTVLDGKFAAIYDAKGRNQAPHGARHIEFNQTGKLASFR